MFVLNSPRLARISIPPQRGIRGIWPVVFLASGIGGAALARLKTPWLLGLEHEPWFLYISVSAALVSLLTFWFAMGPTPWLPRVSGLVVGTASLELLSRLAEDDAELPGLPTIHIVLSAAAFLVLRYWRPGLYLVKWPRGMQAAPSGARLSIATIMFATAVLALILAAARVIRESQNDTPFFVVKAFWASLFIVNALVAVPTMLGERSPLPGLLVVLTTAPALGCLFGYAVEEDDLVRSLQTVSTSCIHAGLLLAALEVVRSSGWRLVDRRRAQIAWKAGLAVASTYGG